MDDEQKEYALHEIREKIERFAVSKSNRVGLEEMKKIMRARLMKAAELEGHTSVSAQEREAYAHPDYLEIIEGLKAATYEETKLWWELQVLQNQFEAWRTRQANARVERSRY